MAELETACAGNHIREVLWQKFVDFEYDAKRMERLMDELSYNNTEQYQRAEKDYKWLIATEAYKQISTQQKSYNKLLSERRQNTYHLSQKDNFSNITKQLKELESGETAADIRKWSMQDVEKAFRKRDSTQLLDSRDLETIYREALACRLLVHRHTPLQTKLRMIE